MRLVKADIHVCKLCKIAALSLKRLGHSRLVAERLNGDDEAAMTDPWMAIREGASDVRSETYAVNLGSLSTFVERVDL